VEQGGEEARGEGRSYDIAAVHFTLAKTQCITWVYKVC
jgi:hypothetical protein